MNPTDLFLPTFLTLGPIIGKQAGWLHYGRPLRPVRWGKRQRGVVATIFGGYDNGSGATAFGDPALIEGPGPMYGTDDDEPSTGVSGVDV